MIRSTAVALALIASPAFADTTAVYEARNGAFKMTIEIADNGDVRGDVNAKPGSYFVTRHGEGFAILPTPAGPVTDRLSDLTEATATLMSERLPGFRENMRRFPHEKAAPQFFVAGGVVSIHGRSGTTYFVKTPPGAVKQPPWAVISHDSNLAPIGPALARQYEMSEQGQIAMIGFVPPQLAQMGEILKSGAPLAFAGAQLTSVNHEPIPRSRFELPGPPESRAAIEKRLRATNRGLSVKAF